MAAESMDELRNEAVACINNAIEYLIEQFPEYGPHSSRSNVGSVCVRVESKKSIINFWWDFRDKHYIALGPISPNDFRVLMYNQSSYTENQRPYSIESLVEFGGRRHPYIEFRKDPLIGVKALIEWVPEFVSGDWSTQRELEEFVQQKMRKRKSHEFEDGE